MSSLPLIDSLVINAALLLVLVLAIDLAATRTQVESVVRRRLLMGVVLGGIGIGVMTAPLTLLPGIVFDVRSVLLAISGLFFGAAPTAVALAMTAAYRLTRGGVGAWPGVLVILSSGLIGVAWRQCRRSPLDAIGWRELLLLGMLVHLVMLAILSIMLWDIVDTAVAPIALPVMLLYPVLTVALGLLLSRRMAYQTGLRELQQSEARRAREQAAAIEDQRQGRIAALNLMDDAVAARTSAEAALAELRESRERLKLALQAANQGIYDLNVQTGEALVSPEYATMLGHDPASFRETHAAWLERLHPDDRERVGQAYRDYIAGRLPEYRVEFRQKTRAGDWKWILSLGKLVARDDAGQALRMLGTHTDITVHKNSEQALAFQARRVEALLALPVAAETLDEREFMQYGMEQAEQLSGSRIAFIHLVLDDQETIELVTWSRATLEHYCQAVADTHYPISQAGIWADALRRRAPVVFNDYAAAPGPHGLPEGHAHLERLISVPVIEGGLVRMIAGVGNKADNYNAQDVETVQLIANTIWRMVSRRRLDAALRESEILNRSTLDSVNAEIVVLDPKGKITAVNQPWRRFALDNASEPGQPVPGTDVGANYLAICRDRSGCAIAEAMEACEGIRAVLEGRLPGFDLEYPCHSPDRQRWFSMRVNPLGAQGLGAVVTHTDITERKLAAAKDRQQLKELRQWYELTLGRENRVVELKSEVNALQRRLGEAPAYASVEASAAGDGALPAPMPTFEPRDS
jgi:PAS domain S-box-containing protein